MPLGLAAAASGESRKWVTTANIAKVESSGTALIGVLQNYREDDTVIIGQGGTDNDPALPNGNAPPCRNLRD